MKPIIVLPPDAMSDEDRKLLADNDICVVVAEDPALIEFLDPIPATVGRDAIQQAAINLSRKILTGQSAYTRGIASEMFVDLLLKGDPLGAPTKRAAKKKRPAAGK